MKALVAYFTKTGNTEKIARAIYESIQFEKEMKPIDQVEGIAGYDVIFCGFPVIAHSVPAKAERFIKGLPEGQAVAFFSTHGALRGGHLPKQAFEHALGLASRFRVLGHFGCRGKVDPAVIETLSRQWEHKAWAEEAMGAHEHPNAADLHDAADFAREVIAKLNK